MEVVSSLDAVAAYSVGPLLPVSRPVPAEDATLPEAVESGVSVESGESGDIGETGESGESVESGECGESGVSGERGVSGESGECGSVKRGEFRRLMVFSC